ncbi:hypothetical protein TNCV_1917811 [Trichonephila clavipes]|uniref:Uncharacterized protein n=1 Tax=Trichonephila clavipes TaxID=2585209 RepID=A0A8X6W156_TRICX|nr:hypothetical protein TNCV_1917811 [Trichonephila clavipes]
MHQTARGHNLCDYGSLRGKKHSKGGTPVDLAPRLIQLLPNENFRCSQSSVSSLVPVILLFYDVSEHVLLCKSESL